MQNWEWTEPTAGQVAFQPTSTGLGLDSWYSSLKALGVSVHQAFRTTPSWIHNGSETGWKPLSNELLSTSISTSDPLQYTSVAAHAFQVCECAVLTLRT